MAPLERFWRALEALPSLAAVTAEWRALLGNDYDLARSFLRPRQELAKSHPCLKLVACGCRHSVVGHGEDDYVAVCTCEGISCDSVRLARADLVVYEVDTRLLCRQIARVFDLTGGFSCHADFRNVFQVGLYYPQTGYEFPVVLVLTAEESDLLAAASGIAARSRVPFLLLTATADGWSPALKDTLEERHSNVGCLSELLGVDNGEFVRQDVSERLFDEFRCLHVPKPVHETELPGFATPPGATWEQVRITFPCDDHTASIVVCEKSQQYHYTQIQGMAMKSGRKVTVQWETLLHFAKGKGRLRWDRAENRARIEKRVERLSQILTDFFRISGQPIETVAAKHEWQARFHISVD